MDSINRMEKQLNKVLALDSCTDGSHYFQRLFFALGEVMTIYPRGYLLQDISKVSNILLEELKIKSRGRLNDWIDLNVGLILPEKMPDRIPSIIDGMIERKKYLLHFIRCSSGD